jgi:hypothetical protein
MKKNGWVSKVPAAFPEWVTPEMAKEMLSTSPGNRKTREWWVSLLAGALMREEWRVTSQGIGFDVTGSLRDGHHRLKACVASGVPFMTIVVLGLPVDCYEVIDTGISRTYGDRLDVDRRVAEVARLACEIGIGESKPTTDQMRPVLASGLEEAICGLLDFCGSKTRYFTSASMRLAACCRIMMDQNIGYSMNQYRALATHDYDSMSAPARALYKQFSGGLLKATNKRDGLARGLKVLDPANSNSSYIRIGTGETGMALTSFVRRLFFAHREAGQA